jgi:hypothetical protein
MRSKGLTHQQNEAARLFLQGLIDHKYGTRTAAAKDLSVSQATVSDFLNKKKEVGEKLLVGLMRIASEAMTVIVESSPGRRRNSEVPPVSELVESAIMVRMLPGKKHKTTIRSISVPPSRGPEIAYDSDEYARLKLHNAAQIGAANMLVNIDHMSKGEAYELVHSIDPPLELTPLAFYGAARRALELAHQKRRAR